MTQEIGVLEKHIMDMGERDFHPDETMKVLTHSVNLFTFVSWGVSKIMVVGKCEDDYVRGMIFKVHTPRYKGMVLITLSFMDYYEVRLLDEGYNVTDIRNNDIMFTELVETINDLIS